MIREELEASRAEAAMEPETGEAIMPVAPPRF
jgi:hypothetical protein